MSDLTCVFDEAWRGKCGKPASGEPALCEKHRDAERYSCWCGEQAVKECSVASSFVCGRPLCADHGCNKVAGGMTGSVGAKHSERGHAQYEAWKKASET
jgi:hypothetical protein